jgi:hypothetical protein
MSNDTVSVEERPVSYGNLTYFKVERHRLVGHQLKFVILDVFKSPNNHGYLVNIQNPDGSTQTRRYYQSSLCDTLDIDL